MTGARRNLRAPLATGLVAAMLVCAGGVVTSTQPDRLDTHALLTLYAQGEYDRAVSAVARATRQQAQVLRAALVSAGHSWAHAAPGRLGPRLLAAAAFALETEAARAERGEWGLSDGSLCAGRCVIEWACVILRARGEADDAERLWQLGAVALVGGVRDWAFLISPLTPNPRQSESGHLRHVLVRLPEEPRLRLARAVALASRYDITSEMEAPRAGVRTEPFAPVLPAIRISPALPASAVDRRRQLLEFAMQPMRDLVADRVVGVEARLRLGNLQWRSGEYEAALETERAAAAATLDPSLKYLAYFVAAQAAQALGDFATAEAMYTRALDVRPASQSATLGLAALRLLEGDAASAYDLVERSRAERRGDDDPWRLFLYGDYTRLPGLIQQLRAKITP